MGQERIAQLLLELPGRWEKLGDLALLPRTSMASPEWGCLGQPLWEAVACALGVKRLAMQAPVADAGDVALCTPADSQCVQTCKALHVINLCTVYWGWCKELVEVWFRVIEPHVL